MDRTMLAERFWSVSRWTATEFGLYDVDTARQDRIVAAFTQWADEIVSPDGD